MQLYEKYKTLFKKNETSTPLRTAHFMAQIEHESAGFKYLKELGSNKYLDKYDTGKLAERLGNTPEDDDDGIKYCGRGYIQITGRANYEALSEDTGIDFITNPELLEQEANAMISALWYWNSRNLNKYADLDDIKTITKKINGGYNGLDDRIKNLNKWKKLLNV
jgi:putative chitinase